MTLKSLFKVNLIEGAQTLLFLVSCLYVTAELFSNSFSLLFEK